MPVKTKRSKYHNVKTVVEGRRFDSFREAQRYILLKVDEEAGLVRNLRCQVRYPIKINGLLICTYIADFVYDRLHTTDGDLTWSTIVEDVKSAYTAKNPVYRLKKKLMEAVLGI